MTPRNARCFCNAGHSPLPNNMQIYFIFPVVVTLIGMAVIFFPFFKFAWGGGGWNLCALETFVDAVLKKFIFF